MLQEVRHCPPKRSLQFTFSNCWSFIIHQVELFVGWFSGIVEEQIPRRKMSCPEFAMRSPRLCFSKRAAKFEIHELRRWFAVHRLPLASAKRRTLRPLSLRPSQYAPSYVQIEHFDDLLFGMEKTGRFSTKFQHNFQFNSREYGYLGINIY